MARPFRTFILAGFAMLLIAASLGCESGFISDAAQDSAADFVNSVVSTAVDEVIGGG